MIRQILDTTRMKYRLKSEQEKIEIRYNLYAAEAAFDPFNHVVF